MRRCCVWNNGETQTSRPQQNCRVAAEGRCTVAALSLFLSFTITAASDIKNPEQKYIFGARLLDWHDLVLEPKDRFVFFYCSLAKHKFRHQNMPGVTWESACDVFFFTVRVGSLSSLWSFPQLPVKTVAKDNRGDEASPKPTVGCGRCQAARSLRSPHSTH